jgi:DNA-directed RNA polymerase specialized sigma24 family protein
MSVKEIAQALGVSPPAVSARLNRAKRKLRIALERRPCHE